MKWMGELGTHGLINAVWLGLFFFQKSDEELDSLDAMHLDT
jgi:hypothetical protein